MAATNDITGDKLISRASTKVYNENYERIFGKTKLEEKLERERLEEEKAEKCKEESL